MFNEKDLQQIESRGIKFSEVEKQIGYFRNGISKIELVRPAIIGDGIETVTKEDEEVLIQAFDELKTAYRIFKFIPASGAASRMFKALFEAHTFLKHHPENEETFFREHPEVKDFFDNLEAYPFYFDLKEKAREKNLDLDVMKKEKDYEHILQLLLGGEGLNYGDLPKGLLKFHSYEGISRTAFEEHFEETMDYLSDEDEEVYLHFTVSPVYRRHFEELAQSTADVYSENRATRFVVEFSEQESGTDTLAVDLDNQPFRDMDGTLVFRPGGHGALLGNLQDIDGSVVFIGNIDNIAPEAMRLFKVRYKKILGGYLLSRVQTIHKFLRQLEQGEHEEPFRTEIIRFIREMSNDEASLLENETDIGFIKKAFDFLNRPVRVCGMVENVGEPGGGPFWVKDNTGKISRQIVERSQVDLSDYGQETILNLSTHFNPVDMVCFTKDFKGEPFDLLSFRDPDLGFISKKSIGGKDIKALELPGLWNGSMADWITYFVDLPLATFTPVKTVFDLLRPEHR